MAKAKLRTSPDRCRQKQTFSKLRYARNIADDRGQYPYLCNVCGKWHLSTLRSDEPAYDPFQGEVQEVVRPVFQVKPMRPKRKPLWLRVKIWIRGWVLTNITVDE